MNPFDLTGRTAVVTGGGRGLGLGISRSLIAAGADVIVLSRGEVPDDLVAHAREHSRAVSGVRVDLADPRSIDQAADQVLARGTVDVLVNNAGTQVRHPAAEFPLDEWDAVLQVNLRAVLQLWQAFGRSMLERRDGKIVNLASLLSFQGGLTVPAYAARDRKSVV